MNARIEAYLEPPVQVEPGLPAHRLRIAEGGHSPRGRCPPWPWLRTSRKDARGAGCGERRRFSGRAPGHRPARPAVDPHRAKPQKGRVLPGSRQASSSCSTSTWRPGRWRCSCAGPARTLGSHHGPGGPNLRHGLVKTPRRGALAPGGLLAVWSGGEREAHYARWASAAGPPGRGATASREAARSLLIWPVFHVEHRDSGEERRLRNRPEPSPQGLSAKAPRPAALRP